MTFVAIRDEKKAVDFYSNIVGLKKLSADSFAVVFDAGAVLLRAALVPEVADAKYTVLGWQVTGKRPILQIRWRDGRGIGLRRHAFITEPATVFLGAMPVC